MSCEVFAKRIGRMARGEAHAATRDRLNRLAAFLDSKASTEMVAIFDEYEAVKTFGCGHFQLAADIDRLIERRVISAVRVFTHRGSVFVISTGTFAAYVTAGRLTDVIRRSERPEESAPAHHPSSEIPSRRSPAHAERAA